MNSKYKYLDLLSRKLDPAQLEVCCRKENTVVAAGAGSGKTQVLATRFAWLLIENEEIRAPMILTLTFTDKAASEMYERIYKTLEFFSGLKHEDFPEEKRFRAERALKDFANVHIQTLDSYCGSILRQTANRYGIRPDFSTGSSDSAKNVQDKALEFVLKHKNYKCIQYYAPAAQIQSFATKFFAKIILEYTTLSTRPDYFSSFIEKQIKFMICEWNRILKCSSIFSKVTEIYEALSNMSESELDKYPDMNNLFKATSEKNIPEAGEFDYDFFISNKENCINQIDVFSEWIKNFEGLKYPTKKDCPSGNSTKAMIKEISEDFSSFHSIAAFFTELEYSCELFSLLDEFLEIVNSQKRTSGALTFADVTSMALRVLVEQKDVRNQEKESFSKIMIDEFQDNNGRNRDLLFLLSEKYDECCEINDFDLNAEAIHDALKDHLEKEKLFFVGDEKQSIYKFRGADVSVFNELKKDLTRINGDDAYKHMIYNYRSVEELLVTFNQFFGSYRYDEEISDYVKDENASFMLESSDVAFEALYDSDAVTKCVDKISHEFLVPKKLNASNCKGHVSMYIEDSKTKEDVENLRTMKKKDQIYYYVAKKIKQLHDEGCEYSKIAILDRSRTDRNIMTKWLQYLHVPYVLDVQNSIFTDGVVNDIYNFLRLCVYPSDRNAFAAFLCSPLCGLNEQDMENILACYNVKTDDKFVPFDTNVTNAVEIVLGSESVSYKKYISAKEYYDIQKTLVLSRPLTETLNELWYSKGYRYETLLNSNVASFSEQYDTLFAVFNEADSSGKSIAWVVDQLAIQKTESFMTKDEQELDVSGVKYPVEKDDGIQIMTIHKSKGLQFDYVFLLGLDHTVGSDASSQFYFSEEYGLTIRSFDGSGNYFFENQRQLSQDKNVAEFRRLGYVGVTRAVKMFWIIASHTITKTESKATTVALLKPVIKSYYPDFELIPEGEVCYSENAPFDYERIKIEPRELLYTFGHRVDIDSLRNEKILNYNKVIESKKDCLVSMPKVQIKKVAPSTLELFSDVEADSEVLESLEQVLPSVDNIVFGSAGEDGKLRFDFAKLGTVLHEYYEHFINGMDEQIISEVLSKYLKDLSDKNGKAVIDFCKKSIELFKTGEIFSEIEDAKKNSRFYSSEYEFKFNFASYLFTGSIDLCYEKSDGSYVIVDYKTDHNVNPEKYYSQQTCYRKALSEIMEVSPDCVKTVLYYVRHNRYIDISYETIKDIDSETVQKAIELGVSDE